MVLRFRVVSAPATVAVLTPCLPAGPADVVASGVTAVGAPPTALFGFTPWVISHACVVVWSLGLILWKKLGYTLIGVGLLLKY